MLDFSGRRFPPEIIMICVRWYVTYPLSYRNVEEMMAERVSADHSTLNRWVIHYSPKIAEEVKRRRRPIGKSWCCAPITALRFEAERPA
jgi:putative transposase